MIKRNVGFVLDRGRGRESNRLAKISRSSSWVTHVVSGERLKCFREGWKR